MTIDEAIEILTDFRKQESQLLGNEFREASALGIEALKLLRANRNSAWPNKANILPGETEV